MKIYSTSDSLNRMMQERALFWSERIQVIASLIHAVVITYS